MSLLNMLKDQIGNRWKFSLILLVFSLTINRSYEGKHYCTRFSYDLHPEASKSEILIPTQSDGSAVELCDWLIKIDRFKGLNQVVLQGVPFGNCTPRSSTSTNQQFHLQYSAIGTEEAGFHAVFPGFFLVLDATKGRQFKLQLNSSGALASPKTCPTGLKIELPTWDNRCGRDMLQFGTNCLALSSAPGNLTDALTSIKGDAQLASFSSMAKIKDFVAANIARKSVHSSPLNLSQRVMIGIFTGAANNAAIFVARNDTTCQLQKFLDPQSIRTNASAGACVSLRVDESNRVVLEPVDCSERMPFLISFPLSPSSMPSWERCSRQLEPQLYQILSPEVQLVNFGSAITVASIIAAVILVLVLLALGLWKACKKSRTTSMNLVEKSTEAEKSDENEASNASPDKPFISNAEKNNETLV